MTTSIRQFLLLLVLTAAYAGIAGAVEVSDAWARATVPGQKVGAAYLKLKSMTLARLVAVSSPICKRVEIHSSSMEGGVMRMRQLKSLNLAAGEEVALAPMGTHLMLMELEGPLKAGEHFTLELTMREGGKRKKVPVRVEVRALTE